MISQKKKKKNLVKTDYSLLETHVNYYEILELI